MNTLIFIGLLGCFSYLSTSYAQTFKGSAAKAKFILNILGRTGNLCFWIFIIWSFFQFVWWQPILTIVCSMLLGGVIGGLFYRNMAMMFISPIGIPVFFALSLISLLNNGGGNSKDTVFVCTGSSSKTYHRIDDCQGLSRCSGEIREVSLEEARKMRRRACKICKPKDFTPIEHFEALDSAAVESVD